MEFHSYPVSSIRDHKVTLLYIIGMKLKLGVQYKYLTFNMATRPHISAGRQNLQTNFPHYPRHFICTYCLNIVATNLRACLGDRASHCHKPESCDLHKSHLDLELNVTKRMNRMSYDSSKPTIAITAIGTTITSIAIATATSRTSTSHPSSPHS